MAGLVLTGGSSRRMGRDKATISVGGQPCAARVAACLSQVVAPVLEVGPGHCGLPLVHEERPGEGPLAAAVVGWDALAAAGHRGPVVILACDLPNVSDALIRFVASRPEPQTVVPVVAGRPQPLCARFSAAALRHGADVVRHGHRSITALLQQTDVRWLDEAEWSRVAEPSDFADIDTPEDLARLGLELR